MSMRQIRANALKQAQKTFIQANRLEKVYKHNFDLMDRFARCQIAMLRAIDFINRRGV